MTDANEPPSSDDAQAELLEHVMVPVAHENDARLTALALKQYNPSRVTVLYVVEKGEGTIDKTPVEYSREVAEKSYSAFQEVFPHSNTKLAYGRDIVGAIFDVADKIDASAIAFRPRPGGRIQQLLSGDLALKLVTRGNRPVIALPRQEAD